MEHADCLFLVSAFVNSLAFAPLWLPRRSEWTAITLKERDCASRRGHLERARIRILLVEDFKSYRDFITSLLGENPDLWTICEASDGVEAVRKAQEHTPDVILMDIGLPQLDGLEAARRIRRLVPSSKIVFLTQETSAEVIEAALSLGAWGYVVKQQAGTDLLAALAAIRRGKRFVSQGLHHDGCALAKEPNEAS